MAETRFRFDQLPNADDLFKKPAPDGHLRQITDPTPPLTKIADGQIYHQPNAENDDSLTKIADGQLYHQLNDENDNSSTTNADDLDNKAIKPLLNPFDDDEPLNDAKLKPKTTRKTTKKTVDRSDDTENPVQIIAELVNEPLNDVETTPLVNPFDDDNDLTVKTDDNASSIVKNDDSTVKSTKKPVLNPFDDDDSDVESDHLNDQPIKPSLNPFDADDDSDVVKNDNLDGKTIKPSLNPFDDDDNSDVKTDDSTTIKHSNNKLIKNDGLTIKTTKPALNPFDDDYLATKPDQPSKNADGLQNTTANTTDQINDPDNTSDESSFLTAEQLNQQRQAVLNGGNFVQNDNNFTPPPFSNQVTITVQAAVYPLNQAVVSSDELPKITEQKIDIEKPVVKKNNGFTNLGIDYRNGLSKTAQQFAKALLMLQASLKILWSLMIVVVICGSFSFLFIMRFGGSYTVDQIIGGSIFDCLTVVVLSVYWLIRLLADRNSVVRYLKNFYDTRNSIKILMKGNQNDQYFDKFNQQLTIGYGGQLADTDF